ncbi:hypothetical protein [Catellatospora sichuanensis]|uniref:hypothetical protein n=1 Tax=Catellatospora sichuanensis TaxID=1969805 RepID=UPI0016426D19|nr:hypothetical protein [Catellatospora sichuanensis]
MTPTPPQPDNTARNITVIVAIAAVAIVCIVAVACLGPLGLFAWMADRQMDWFEEQSSDMPMPGFVLRSAVFALLPA